MLAGAYAETGNEAKARGAYQGAGRPVWRRLDAVRLSSPSANSTPRTTADAVGYAQKAIDQAQKEGKKPSSTHYNIMLNAYRESGDLDKYYATLERVAPILN